MNLTHLSAFTTVAGGAVFTRTVLLSDIAWTQIGGIAIALITTAGGIAIALINRPARRARAEKSREQREDDHGEA